MSDIFISYKREDQDTARAIAEALERAGCSLWWDPQLRSGERFDDVIERELNLAKCVIVLWSHRSVQSQYVKDEAAHALKLNKLVPVAIEEVELPLRFEGLQTLFLTGWDGSASFPAFQKLLEDVGRIIGKKKSPNRKINVPQKPELAVPAEAEISREPTPPQKSVSTKPLTTVPKRNWLSKVLSGTATYGHGFKSTGVLDEYLVRIYVSAVVDEKGAYQRAVEEIETFMQSAGYAAYEITNQKYSYIFGHYDYTVKFSR